MKTTIRTLLGAGLSLLATVTAASGAGHSGGGQTTMARIAISAAVVNHKTGGTSYQIFAINPDGSGAKQLTQHGGGFPVWSHDQKYIAFERSGMDSGTIYVMDGANGEFKGGPEFPVVQVSPSGHDWWPDDSGIVYTSSDGGIWFVSVDLATGAVGTPVLLRDGGDGQCLDPKVSPDGTKLAYARQGIVRVFDLNTQTEVTIPGSNYAPNWSPDGKKIAFEGVVCYDGNGWGYAEVVIANGDGTGGTPVTALQSYSSWPAWSPDGTQIAFFSQVSGSKAVYKTTIGSGTVTLLYDGVLEGLDWAP